MCILDALSWHRNDGDFRSLPNNIIGNEPDAPGCGHSPHRIAAGLDMENAWARAKIAGANLGASEIHYDLTSGAGLPGCSPDVFDHAGPYFLRVVGAVDSGNVHSSRDHLGYKRQVATGFGRKCDHNGGIAAGRTVAENGLPARVVVRVCQFDRRELTMGFISGCWRHGLQGHTHCPDRSHDIALNPAKGRQAQSCQALLEVANVGLTQRQVVHQVQCAIAKVRVNCREILGVMRLESNGVVVDRLQLSVKLPDVDRLSHERPPNALCRAL